MIERRRHEHGFTLVEILVVIVVLGVLAAVVVFSVSGSTTKAQTNACALERRLIRTALNVYDAKNGAYPSATQGLPALTTAGFLSTDPDPTKWLYDPAGNDVVGIGKCLGLAGPT